MMHVVQLVELVCVITTCEAILSFVNVFPNSKRLDKSIWNRALTSLVAVTPALCQDVARVASKLRRGHLYAFCLHFDWMDGQEDHVAATRMGLGIRLVVFILVWFLFWCLGQGKPVTSLMVTMLIGAIFYGWTKSQVFSRQAIEKEYVCQLPPLKLGSLEPAPFVVLAHQRTGSNYLCGILHNHKEILMHGEVFNEHQIFLYKPKPEDKVVWDWDVCSRDRDPCGFLLDAFSKLPFQTAKWNDQLTPKVVGFKLFPEHWRGENGLVFQRMMADSRVKKIILKRENRLQTYVSKVRADRTGHYLGKSLNGEKVSVDLCAFQQFLDHYDDCYQYYENLLVGQSVFRMSYETLTSDKADEALKSLLEFLQVNSSKIPRSLEVTVKQSSADELKLDVLNYHELEFAFRNTDRAVDFYQ